MINLELIFHLCPLFNKSSVITASGPWNDRRMDGNFVVVTALRLVSSQTSLSITPFLAPCPAPRMLIQSSKQPCLAQRQLAPAFWTSSDSKRHVPPYWGDTFDGKEGGWGCGRFPCLRVPICCRGGEQCCFYSAGGNPSRRSSRLQLQQRWGDAVTELAVSPLSAGAWWHSQPVWLAWCSSQPMHWQGVSGNHSSISCSCNQGQALVVLGFLKPCSRDTVSIN